VVLRIHGGPQSQYQRWWEFELGLPWENREMWEKRQEED